MSLSQNIKQFRIRQNMTQEQLAARIGVSPQAVSKWERSETYPDGALLLPLARALDVSLDVLFDNDEVSMEDIARRILLLFHGRSSREGFAFAREICWQIEKGLFFRYMSDTVGTYSPDETAELHAPSYILTNHGFTVVSNGKVPFFTLFPESEEGYAPALEGNDELTELLARLNAPHVLPALFFLHRQTEGYVFEREILSRACGISPEETDALLDELIALRTVCRKPLLIDGVSCVLYEFTPRHQLLAMLLMAGTACYTGTYTLTGHKRSRPLLR